MKIQKLYDAIDSTLRLYICVGRGESVINQDIVP